MPRFTRRTKIISIRVSDEEFEQLQTLCVSGASDSISDLARKGMKLLIRQGTTDDSGGVDSRFHEIDSRVSILDREVARLSDLMGLTRIDADMETQQ